MPASFGILFGLIVLLPGIVHVSKNNGAGKIGKPYHCDTDYAIDNSLVKAHLLKGQWKKKDKE
jgi:hypothetical protein